MKNLDVNESVSQTFQWGRHVTINSGEACSKVPPEDLSGVSLETKTYRLTVESVDSPLVEIPKTLGLSHTVAINHSIIVDDSEGNPYDFSSEIGKNDREIGQLRAAWNRKNKSVWIRRLRSNPYHYSLLTGSAKLGFRGYTSTSQTNCGWWWDPRWTNFTVDWNYPIIPYITMPNRYCTASSEAYKQAVNAFYSEASSIKMNLGVALAERRQTVNLIASTANRIARAFLNLKRGNIKGASRALGVPLHRGSRRQDAASKWLEYHYGWMPLLSDIYGAMAATVEKPVKIPMKITRKTNEKFSLPSHPGGGDSIYHNTLTNCSVHDSVTVKGWLVPDERATTVHDLGLSNPALAAWELIPFSFVADWFLPVGDWLEAQTALLGLTVEEFSITSTRRIFADLDTSAPPAIPPGQYGRVAFSGNRYSKTKVRDLVIPPVPLPQWKNPLSVSHAISGVSLLQQIFGNKSR